MSACRGRWRAAAWTVRTTQNAPQRLLRGDGWIVGRARACRAPSGHAGLPGYHWRVSPFTDPAADHDGARCFALVPCAGVGERAGQDLPKQYARIGARAMVAHTLAALAARAAAAGHAGGAGPRTTRSSRRMRRTSAASAPGSRAAAAPRAPPPWPTAWPSCSARGARAGDWVLVHDAARCLLRPEWVDRLIDACRGDAVGGLLALPLADTLKQARAGRVERTLDRSDKWAAQTPQMFRLGLLQQALAQAGAGRHRRGQRGGGRSAMRRCWCRRAGELQAHLAAGPGAGRALAARTRAGGCRMSTSLRIGEGWDTHALVAGRPLILGGVTHRAQPWPARPFGCRRAAARHHRRAVRRRRPGRHRPPLPGHRPGLQGRRFAGAAGRGGAPRARRRLGHRQRRQHHRRAGAEDGAAHPGDVRAASRMRWASTPAASTSRPRRPRRWARWARAAPSRRAPSACCSGVSTRAERQGALLRGAGGPPGRRRARWPARACRPCAAATSRRWPGPGRRRWPPCARHRRGRRAWSAGRSFSGATPGPWSRTRDDDPRAGARVA